MSSFQIYESDVEFDDHKPAFKPNSKKTWSELYSEMMMWRARAKQNQAELEVSKAKSIASTKKLGREASGLRHRLREAQERISELEGEQQ